MRSFIIRFFILSGLIFSALAPQALAAVPEPISNTRMFVFVEANFPSIFSGTATAGQYEQYDYRYYPASGNYLAVDTSGVIYVVGTYTGGAVITVGPVESFRSYITAWEQAPAPSYQSAFDTCYDGTPAMYNTAYCTAYANAIVAGSAPAAANQAGAAAAHGNIGNIGMGETVSATGTPPATSAGTGGTTINPNYVGSFSGYASGVTLNWTISNTGAIVGTQRMADLGTYNISGYLQGNTIYMYSLSGSGSSSVFGTISGSTSSAINIFVMSSVHMTLNRQ